MKRIKKLALLTMTLTCAMGFAACGVLPQTSENTSNDSIVNSESVLENDSVEQSSENNSEENSVDTSSDDSSENTSEITSETTSEEESVHEHVWGDAQVIEPAVCGKEGQAITVCAGCGSFEYVTLPALEHIWDVDNVTVVLGTCVAELHTKTPCLQEGCQEFRIVKGEKNPNNHAQVVTDAAVAPTCITTGLTEGQHCEACNETLKEQTTIDFAPHTEKTVAGYAPTCTKTGLTDGTVCEVCGETLKEQETISANGHDFVDRKCTVCGEKKTSEGLEMTLSANKQYYSVTGIGSCEDTELIIPATHNGLPVTIINARAFENQKGLTDVEIPDSITAIRDYAFYYCSGLTEIVIPDSVTDVGIYAFYRCENATSLKISNSLKVINNFVFQWCSNLTTVEIPQSVTTIATCAFMYCKKLESIILPETITEIGYGAFDGCKLKEIEFPNSLLTIGDNAFYNCDSLTSVAIPDYVTSIGSSAFEDCDGIKSVEIGNGVTTIGKEAFYGCGKLTSVVIGKSVVSIGERTFFDCDKLTSVVFKVTEGWKQYNNGAVSSEVLADAGQAAKKLTALGYYWTRTVTTE